MTVPARRPLWRRRHWIAAAALWLVLAYPLSTGPAVYAVGRGWLDPTPLGFVYAPVLALASAAGPRSDPYADDLSWWDELAIRHAESD